MGAKLTKEQAEVVDALTRRLAHHDANPWRDVTGAIAVRADQQPITIWNAEFDAIIDAVPHVPPGWEHLRAQRAVAQGACREYAGIWVRQMLAALRGEIGGVSASKEG